MNKIIDELDNPITGVLFLEGIYEEQEISFIFSNGILVYGVVGDEIVTEIDKDYLSALHTTRYNPYITADDFEDFYYEAMYELCVTFDDETTPPYTITNLTKNDCVVLYSSNIGVIKSNLNINNNLKNKVITSSGSYTTANNTSISKKVIIENKYSIVTVPNSGGIQAARRNMNVYINGVLTDTIRGSKFNNYLYYIFEPIENETGKIEIECTMGYNSAEEQLENVGFLPYYITATNTTDWQNRAGFINKIRQAAYSKFDKRN